MDHICACICSDCKRCSDNMIKLISGYVLIRIIIDLCSVYCCQVLSLALIELAIVVILYAVAITILCPMTNKLNILRRHSKPLCVIHFSWCYLLRCPATKRISFYFWLSEYWNPRTILMRKGFRRSWLIYRMNVSYIFIAYFVCSACTNRIELKYILIITFRRINYKVCLFLINWCCISCCT